MPPSLRERIDAAIRPAMLIGLQDAELHDQPGRERIGEWADSITEWVLAVVQPELDARDSEIDRLRADLAAARNTAFAEAADHLDRTADEVEAKVAAYYGPTSGIGPGSADMVRMDAKEIRALVTHTTTSSGPTGDPIAVRWDRTVIHPNPSIPGDDTIVCCLTDDGRPVALFLDDEYREALGLQLVDPEGC
ncbi:hypothetical protein ACPC54_17855 [Kitasatospora sp. NPDC094028]